MLVAGPASATHDHIEARMVEVAEIHRHRLGVAEQERRVREQQHGGQDHGAERVDMLQRVEADAPKLPGGVVTEPVCDKAVRGLMEGDGDQEGEHPGGDVVERDVQALFPDRVR